MEKFMILLAGSPATGKTYLINELKETLPDMFVITPDEGKEMLADSIGFDNLDQKQELEIQVWDFYYQVLNLYMKYGKRVILSEYPFSYKQKNHLKMLAEKYDYKVITIRLVADFDVLWERRKKRDIDPTRHLSHIKSHYHYGDTLEDRTQADALITKEEFRNVIETRGYNQFEIGKLFEIDVTDFSLVDYTDLKEELDKIINNS